MIDWKKPVRTKCGTETISEAMTGYIISLETLLAKHVVDKARDGFAVENIPKAVAPVEIQEAFEEGYEVGCNHPFGNDISKATAAWHNSASKQINIGKRVV